jgi:hypothetical protein
LLEVADAYRNAMKALDFTGAAPKFATALLASLKNYPISNRQLDYHPAVALFDLVLRADYTLYGLTDEDSELLGVIVDRGKENFRALKARSAVGRVEAPKGTGIATGVLIGENTLLTCYHVLWELKRTSNQAWIRFNYKKGSYALDYYVFELALPTLQGRGDTDYALVRLKAKPAEQQFIRPQQKDLGGSQPIRIIHHPRGSYVVISERESIIKAGDDYIEHRIKTDEGSSGAPIFDSDWALVGIHKGDSGIIRSNRTPNTKDGVPVYTFHDAISAYLNA